MLVRLVFWNCNMGLHKKLEALASLRPDVAVVSECAKPEIVASKTQAQMPSSMTWVGENPQKGVGVLGYGDYQVTLDPAYDAPVQFIAPVRVTGPTRFNVLGVWARHEQRPAERGATLGPLLRALDMYEALIQAAPTAIGGDLNNHVVFDKPGKANNHVNAVARLKSLGLFSAYHRDRGVAQGQEPEPTHYWRDRTKDGFTYHIDYCFLPDVWEDALREVYVGTYEECIHLSDHVPLVADVSFPGV